MSNTRSVLARRVHPMSTTRRQFLQSSTTMAAATSLVGMTAIFEVACSSTTALAEVERFEPVVINALTLACAINSGLPVCGSEQSKITADYNTVIQLWTDYNKAVAAGTSTVAIWNDLNAAFTVFEEDSSLIFAGPVPCPSMCSMPTRICGMAGNSPRMNSGTVRLRLFNSEQWA